MLVTIIGRVGGAKKSTVGPTPRELPPLRSPQKILSGRIHRPVAKDPALHDLHATSKASGSQNKEAATSTASITTASLMDIGTLP